MIESDTLSVLQKATTAAVAASTLATLPVKYVDQRTFKVPDDQKYLECVFIPNNSDTQYYGDEKQYQGLYRLLLHWPIDNGSAYRPMQLLESICGYFSKGRFLGPVKIAAVPNMTGIVVNGADTIYAASIRYARFEA